MKKRLSSILLLICLMLSGCNSGENSAGQMPDITQIPESSQGAELTEAPEAIETPIPSTEPIELKIYSQLSGYWGEQQGWFAQVLLDKFNVKFHYIMEHDVEEPQKVADIIIYGSKNQYLESVEKGWLLDWEANDLLKEHGAYIAENMPLALEYNRSLTSEEGGIFGMGINVVPSIDVSEDFFLTWDIRWDLYQELGYPEIVNLADFANLLEDMKTICPMNEAGEAVYALSLWPDWDNGMLMTAKCMATAYYGYDEHHLGLYDTKTGTFYGALEEDGPYLEMLRFLNGLYRKGLLDPDSVTQSYDDMMIKLKNDRVLFSVFDYAGSKAYNTEEHMTENKYMASLVPQEASPAAYGLSVYGSVHRIWTIGAGTEHAQLVMDIINWLSAPEGRLTYEYGPQGVNWDYDEEGNTYLTELGKACMDDRTTRMPNEYGATTFNDGCPQINAVTWSYLAPNLQSNGETYNFRTWKSNTPEVFCDMEQNWREFTGTVSANEYIKGQNYVVIPEVNYEATEKGSELEETWKLVAECIENGSWDAIYAESEEKFERVVDSMQTEAAELGYEKCMTWCAYEAMRRGKLEEAVRK